MDLADVLPRPAGPTLWQGRVADVVGTKFVHLDYAQGQVLNAGLFDGATYVEGDYVWFLLDDNAGALVLGRQNPGVHDNPVPPAGSPLIVDDIAFATYDTVTGLWTASTLVQSPTQVACWFYSTAAFASVVGIPLARFELEVTRTAGGPPEFGTHLNSTAVGVLDRGEGTYLRDQPPTGVATWVALPLDWGMQLVAGTIKGLTIGGSTYSGTYSGTGRVRVSAT